MVSTGPAISMNVPNVTLQMRRGCSGCDHTERYGKCIQWRLQVDSSSNALPLASNNVQFYLASGSFQARENWGARSLLRCNISHRVNNTRVAEEQHPFHLHGYHFWVLGTGMGVYSKAAFGASLNTVNPVSRDTVNVIKGGWTVIRFQAS